MPPQNICNCYIFQSSFGFYESFQIKTQMFNKNLKANKLKNMNVTGDGSAETEKAVQSHLTAFGYYRVIKKRQIRLQMTVQ